MKSRLPYLRVLLYCSHIPGQGESGNENGERHWDRPSRRERAFRKERYRTMVAGILFVEEQSVFENQSLEIGNRSTEWVHLACATLFDFGCNTHVRYDHRIIQLLYTTCQSNSALLIIPLGKSDMRRLTQIKYSPQRGTLRS